MEKEPSRSCRTSLRGVWAAPSNPVSAAVRQAARTCTRSASATPEASRPRSPAKTPGRPRLLCTARDDDALRLLVDPMAGMGLRNGEALAVGVNAMVANDVHRVPQQVRDRAVTLEPLKYRNLPLPTTFRKWWTQLQTQKPNLVPEGMGIQPCTASASCLASNAFGRGILITAPGRIRLDSHERPPARDCRILWMWCGRWMGGPVGASEGEFMLRVASAPAGALAAHGPSPFNYLYSSGSAA